MAAEKTGKGTIEKLALYVMNRDTVLEPSAITALASNKNLKLPAAKPKKNSALSYMPEGGASLVFPRHDQPSEWPLPLPGSPANTPPGPRSAGSTPRRRQISNINTDTEMI